VPAGVHDVIGRLWAERVKPVLGTIVIDNRGGGGGVIGANDVAHAQSDGYSILLGSTSTQVLSPAAMAQPPYDPAKSFAGVSVFSFSSTSIVVNPAVPVHSLRELIAYAKANPARAGKVRILSVNSAERIKAAPEIPTSTEAGLPGMVAQTTFAIFAPAGTPAAIVDRLDAATQKVMADFESRLRADAGRRRRKGHRGVQG
jgi:tripartite-type tricarboxylate transporter receptor subunit TctC